MATKKLNKDENYCRKCQEIMPVSKFYDATNLNLDSNGYMSICRECCNNLYKKYFQLYNNVEKAIYMTCMDLDVCFNSSALQAAQKHMESMLDKGKKADQVFGYYKSKLGSTTKANGTVSDFRFKNSGGSNDNVQINNENVDEDFIMFWGGGFSLDDYQFLEGELSRWKNTHKCDNQAEITLLKEICIKVLETRRERESNGNTSAKLKELQELMKTASVDPAKANIASAGKSIDSFGVWIKDIEQFTPAEWYDQQDKYKDMDGFIPYIQNYIIRPIRNFITGNRDFQIDGMVDDIVEDGDE